MKVDQTSSGLTARQMTAEQLEAVEHQLQGNGIAYNKTIDYDDMNYVLTVEHDDIYTGLPQVDVVPQGRRNAR